MKLSYNQALCYFSKAKHNAIFGGRGSGKTFLGALWTYKKISEDPSVPGLICANTHRQLQNVSLKALFELFDSMNMVENRDYVFNKNPKWYKSKFPKHEGILSLKRGGQIICTALENYKTSDGINAGFMWSDEGKDTKEEAIKVMIERVRRLHNTGTQFLYTSTPCGKNHWFYDYFFTGKRGYFSRFCSTYENKKNLPDGYIEQLLEMYDAKMILERVFGQFIDYSGGNAYHTFSQSNIKDCWLDIERPLHIGMDFNVNPFCATISQFDYNRKTIYQPQEIYLENSNTIAMIDYIHRKFPKWYSGKGIYIYPDPTGNKRQTNSTQTDIQMLKNAGFNVMIKKKIIPIRERLNVVNGKMKNSVGDIGYFVSPNCKMTIRDLNKVTLKDDGTIDGRKDKTLTHISDALGYFMYYHFNREALINNRKIA